MFCTFFVNFFISKEAFLDTILSIENLHSENLQVSAISEDIIVSPTSKGEPVGDKSDQKFTPALTYLM